MRNANAIPELNLLAIYENFLDQYRRFSLVQFDIGINDRDSRSCGKPEFSIDSFAYRRLRHAFEIAAQKPVRLVVGNAVQPPGSFIQFGELILVNSENS